MALLSGCGGQSPEPVGGLGSVQQSATFGVQSAHDDKIRRVGPANLGTLEYVSALPTFSDFSGTLIVGPDGNLWYPTPLASGCGAISKFGPSGETIYHLPGCGPTGNNQPTTLVDGPDGRIWFGTFQAAIGAIDTSGNVQYYAGPSECLPRNGCTIVVGSVVGQNIWFDSDSATSNPALQVGYINASTDVVTAFSVAATPSLSQIVLGSDGNLWLGASTEVKQQTRYDVVRVTPTGSVAIFPTKFPSSAPIDAIISGPDGDLWFTTTANVGPIARMNTSGKVQSITFLGATQLTYGLAVGPDNHVWVTTYNSTSSGTYPALVRMNSPKRYTSIVARSKYDECVPLGITVGPNGNLWFSSYTAGGTSARRYCSYGLGTIVPKSKELGTNDRKR